MTRVFLFLTCVWGVAAAAEENFNWPVDDLKAVIGNLPCGKYLETVGFLPSMKSVVTAPDSPVPLRARETAARLAQGAGDEMNYQKLINRFFKSNPGAGIFKFHPPSRKKDVTLQRTGMLGAWNQINRAAWSFTAGYEPYVRAALGGHVEALAQLDVKAQAMINGIRKEWEVAPVAEAIGLLYAQIMDGSRALVDELYSKSERDLRVNVHSDQSPLRVRDLLTDFGAAYDEPMRASAVARLDEPDVVDHLARTIQYVRRWREIERAALDRPGHAKIAARAREVVKLRLRNDWSLLSATPRWSGRQISDLRAGLSKLRTDLRPYVDFAQLNPLDEITRELLLGKIHGHRLLGEIILRATAELPVKIDPPVAPVAPVAPTATPYVKSRIPGVTLINRRTAEKVDADNQIQFAAATEEYRARVRAHRAALIEHGFSENALIERYDQRSRARRVFLMFLAYLRPYEAFRMDAVVSHLPLDPTPDEMRAHLERSFAAAFALRREAARTIQEGFAGTSPAFTIVELRRQTPPTIDYAEGDYLAWVTYAYVMLPDLFPGVAKPPARVPPPRVNEFRPRFSNPD